MDALRLAAGGWRLLSSIISVWRTFFFLSSCYYLIYLYHSARCKHWAAICFCFVSFDCCGIDHLLKPSRKGGEDSRLIACVKTWHKASLQRELDRFSPPLYIRTEADWHSLFRSNIFERNRYRDAIYLVIYLLSFRTRGMGQDLEESLTMFEFSTWRVPLDSVAYLDIEGARQIF